jgi:hypothetical protein
MRWMFLTLAACTGEPISVDTSTPQDTDCEPVTWFDDADGDGFGDPDTERLACDAGEGAVAVGGDCHDDNPDAFPGSHSTEVPGDGVDQDCDGLDACTDLSCDGWPDIVFAQTDDGDSYAIDSWIYLGGPKGYSADARWSVATVGAMGVDAADLDGDGYLDLVFASVQDGVTRLVDSLVYYGGPDGFSTDRRVALPTIGCADPTIGDVDADGWPDIVFSNRYRGGEVELASYQNDSYVYWGGPDGFSEERRLDLPTVGAARSRVADLNGDGFSDVVFASGILDILGHTESVVYWGSDGGLGATSRALPSSFAEGLAVDDLDGDGALDVLLTSWMCLSGCDVANLIYWGDDLKETTQLDGIGGAVDAQVADLNGDGWPDLVLANGAVDWSGNFATESWVYLGGEGGFSKHLSLPATAASSAGIADLDGDGQLDIVFASHYEPAEGGPQVSQIYWGQDGSFDAERLTELPTQHAAGMIIVGR